MSATPTTAKDHQDTPTQPPEEGETSGFSGAYKTGGAKVKAFSGKGHTLSSSSSGVGGASEDSARGARRAKRKAEDRSKVHFVIVCYQIKSCDFHVTGWGEVR